MSNQIIGGVRPLATRVPVSASLKRVQCSSACVIQVVKRTSVLRTSRRAWSGSQTVTSLTTSRTKQTLHGYGHRSKAGVVRCQGEDSNDENSSKDNKETKGPTTQFLGQNMDAEMAKKVAAMIDDEGIKTPEDLKRWSNKRFFGTAAVQGFQVALNLAIMTSFFNWADVAQQADNAASFPLSVLLVAAGVNYGVRALGGAVTLSATTVATYRFGANAETFLATVKEMSKEAEPEPIFDPLASARAAVNSVTLLRKMADLRYELQSAVPTETSSFENLSALVAVQSLDAEPSKSYSPDNAPSSKEMMRIAKAFKKYDKNDDDRLQIEEIEKLAMDFGKPLSQEELLVAMDILDSDKNGTVELDEFVKWWTESCTTEPCVVEPAL